MFKIKESKESKEIAKLKEELIGYDLIGHTFRKPAIYSALGRLKQLEEARIRDRELICLLLEELGYSVEEAGARLVKKKKKRK